MTNRKYYRHLQPRTWALIFSILIAGGYGMRAIADPAIKIDGRTYGVEELTKEHQGRFYTIEQKKYELINEIAEEKYLESYFQKLAQTKKITPEKARQEFLDAQTKVSDREVQDTLGKFKDHPALKDKSESDRRRAVADYLKQNKGQDVIGQILREATAKKQLLVLYPEPQEPVYAVAVNKQDFTRYGPIGEEEQNGCVGDTCPITVVEYSDFECPYCERAQNASQQVLKEYQGKIRWIVRDYPLDFHARSKPAAIAAHCAKDQGKYWDMYTEIFRSQHKLSDADLKKIADRIGLDGKAYDKCLSQPANALALIDSNMRSGQQLGVTGTPTYFVNGRRVSGALPFEAFKRVIDQSLARK